MSAVRRLSPQSAARAEPRRPQLGLCVAYPAPGIVERIGGDWDWIWIDGQHGQMGYRELLEMVRASDLIGRPAFVRVPGHEPAMIGQILDLGVAGVIVPCVDTPAQARTLVQVAKFPPLGNRSYGGRRAIDRAGRRYAESANRTALLILQIETPQGLANVERIGAVPGVDALFYGADDMLLRRGGNMTEPAAVEVVRADLSKITATCRRHELRSVTVAGTEETLNLAGQLDVDFIVCGSDSGFLTEASQRRLQTAKSRLGTAQ